MSILKTESLWRQGRRLKGYAEQLQPLIKRDLAEYLSYARAAVETTAMHGLEQLHHQRNYYLEQTREMEEQILRQHQVIILMRQELEDLMVMINQKQGRESDSQFTKQESDIKQDPRGKRRISYEPILQTIEEQTERTLQSSARSPKSRQQEDFYDHTPEPRPQSLKKQSPFIKIQQAQSSEEEGNPLLEAQAYLEQEDIEYEGQNQIDLSNLPKYDSSGMEQITQEEEQRQNIHEQHGMELYREGEGQQSGKESERNTATQRIPRGELMNITMNVANTTDKQPKTRRFLEEFRKTFSKCISANVSRKNSRNHPATASLNQSSSPITYSLNAPHASTNKYILDRQKPDHRNSKEDSHRLINQMLKDLDNNNKFLIGARKLELKYDGEKKDTLRHGTGFLYYSNGLCYEGQFKANLRHGAGILRFNHIQIYNGKWANDQLCGQGKIRNCAIINKKKASGPQSLLGKWISYCGQFKNNRFEGQGVLYLQGGQKFAGKFICGLACGEGKLYKKNGETEAGVWRNNHLFEKF